ncbi:hypothetical protein AVEN_245763-1, partial [Araneus ventricosus]
SVDIFSARVLFNQLYICDTKHHKIHISGTTAVEDRYFSVVFVQLNDDEVIYGANIRRNLSGGYERSLVSNEDMICVEKFILNEEIL